MAVAKAPHGRQVDGQDKVSRIGNRRKIKVPRQGSHGTGIARIGRIDSRKESIGRPRIGGINNALDIGRKGIVAGNPRGGIVRQGKGHAGLLGPGLDRGNATPIARSPFNGRQAIRRGEHGTGKIQTRRAHQIVRQHGTAGRRKGRIGHAHADADRPISMAGMP